MKAALISAYGGPDKLTVGELPTPAIRSREVLVKVRAAAVNPKDTFIRKGRFKPFSGRSMPLQTGFDFAGEVVAVGAQVKNVAAGDLVYGMLPEVFHGRACAEYLAVRPEHFAVKPESVGFEEAAALPLATLTALQALRDDGGVRPGSRVCINGASGGVGSMAVQIASIMGAEVTALSRSDNHEFLRGLGAQKCLDYREVDIRQSDSQFDIFFDVFGNQPFDSIRRVIAPGGVWVSTVLQPHVFTSVLRSRFSSGPRANLVVVKSKRKDLELLRGWVEQGTVKPIVQAVYPMSEIAEAHRQQESKHTRGKIVIAVQSA